MSCDDDEVGAITALVLVALGHGGGVEVILGQSYVSVYVIKVDIEHLCIQLKNINTIIYNIVYLFLWRQLVLLETVCLTLHYFQQI